MVPRALGAVPRVLGVVPRVLGTVPRVLGGGPQGTRGGPRVLGDPSSAFGWFPQQLLMDADASTAEFPEDAAPEPDSESDEEHIFFGGGATVWWCRGPPDRILFGRFRWDFFRYELFLDANFFLENLKKEIQRQKKLIDSI